MSNEGVQSRKNAAPVASPDSAGAQKVREYAERIRSGESKDAILEGLPYVFRQGIEAELRDDSEPKAARQSPEDGFSEFRMKNGETDEGFFWNEYRNRAAKELKASGQFEWGKERIYFDVPIQDCEKLRDLALRIAGEQKIPIAFKYIDDEKTFPVHKDGSETRFVMNFATSDDARRFYSSLAQAPEYLVLKGDRTLDYKGIRIDDLAEYASGFRERRGALERVLAGTADGAGGYEYFAESGRKIRISVEEYEGFKQEYEKLEEATEKERVLWKQETGR